MVFKLNTDGNMQWIKQQPSFNTDDVDVKPSIAVDKDGNPHIAYQTDGTASGQTNASEEPVEDIVVFKLNQCKTMMLSGTGTIKSDKVFNPSLDIEWIRQQPSFNTPATDVLPSIVVDKFNNTYVAYHTDGTTSGQTNSGGKDIVVFKLNKNGDTVWVRQQPVFNTDRDDLEPSIDIDKSGNLFIAYHTDFGTASGQTNFDNSFDIVVFKMDSDGQILWIKQQPSFNTDKEDSIPTIAIGESGNAYVAYRTSGVASGQTKTGLSNEIVVFKLDTDGNTQWIRQQSAFNTMDNDTTPSIAVDMSDNVYVAYRTDAGTASGQMNLNFTLDIVVFKLDSDGSVKWVRQQPSFNTSDNDSHPSIGVDDSGNVYVAYFTNEGVASGQTNTGSFDIVVFKLDTDGNTQWVRQQPTFNTDMRDDFPSLRVDASGNVYVVYETDGTASGQVSTGDQDIVIFKLDTDGNTQWIKQAPSFNTDKTDSLPVIAISKTGTVCVAYYTDGTASGQTNFGDSYDIVVFKLREFFDCFIFHICLSNSLDKQEISEILSVCKETLPITYTICGHLTDVC